MGEASDSGTTAIFLTTGYKAESTSNSTDDFVEELERQLLETAVLAALGCDSDELRRDRFLLQSSRHLVKETVIVGTYF